MLQSLKPRLIWQQNKIAEFGNNDQSVLRLPSFNLAQRSPLGGAALSHTVQSFHFNQVPLQRTIVFLYRWRQTETQRLHTLKKKKNVCSYLIRLPSKFGQQPLDQPATASLRHSHLANFCISVKGKSWVTFVLFRIRTNMATLVCYLYPDQWLWAVGSCGPFLSAGCSCSLNQTTWDLRNSVSS